MYDVPPLSIHNIHAMQSSTSSPAPEPTSPEEHRTYIIIAYILPVCRSGGLANVFGRRPIMLGGLLVFTIGSTMCGAAKNG
jgi:hypothetical protein